MFPKSIPRWLLPASLSMNIFLAVTVAAHMQSHGFRPPPSQPSPARMIEEIAATLPSADAEILRQVFIRHADQIESAHHVRRALHDAVREALSAPTFDPNALRAAFAEGRRGRATMDDALESAIIEVASQMSVAGRRKLGDWTPSPPRPPDR